MPVSDTQARFSFSSSMVSRKCFRSSSQSTNTFSCVITCGTFAAITKPGGILNAAHPNRHFERSRPTFSYLLLLQEDRLRSEKSLFILLSRRREPFRVERAFPSLRRKRTRANSNFRHSRVILHPPRPQTP